MVYNQTFDPGDMPKIAIDIFGSFGIQVITWAGVIIIFILVIWALSKMKK